ALPQPIRQYRRNESGALDTCGCRRRGHGGLARRTGSGTVAGSTGHSRPLAALHHRTGPDGSGCVHRQWSIFTLGRFFTADVRLRPGQTVVERGPYRWVRHPSYSGLVLFFIGMGLALGNYLALAVLAIVPAAGLIPRIHAEERVLLQGLGDPYRQFAASRSRLFPRIW